MPFFPLLLLLNLTTIVLSSQQQDPLSPQMIRKFQDDLRKYRRKFAHEMDLDYPTDEAKDDLSRPLANPPPFNSDEADRKMKGKATIQRPKVTKATPKASQIKAGKAGAGSSTTRRSVFPMADRVRERKKVSAKDWKSLYALLKKEMGVDVGVDIRQEDKQEEEEEKSMEDLPQDVQGRWNPSGLLALQPSSGSDGGKWKQVRMCKLGSYVLGLALKVGNDEERPSKDSKGSKAPVAKGPHGKALPGSMGSKEIEESLGIRGVRVICQDPSLKTEVLQSNEDRLGSWGKFVNCSSGSHVKAIRVKSSVPDQQHRLDSSPIVLAEAYCSQNGHHLQPLEEGRLPNKGVAFSWSSYQSCQDREVVCGVRVKAHRRMGVTRVNFLCCALPSNFYDFA